jgi:cell wall-associated NlpC family hydrolase
VSQEGFNGYVHEDYIEGDYLKYLPTKSIDDSKRYTLTQQEVANSKALETTSPSLIAVSKDLVTKAPAASPTQQAVPVSNAGTTLGQKIVADAKQFLGNPYVYGGNSLTSGVDCSGFTQQIMKRHGIAISRSSASQYANDGYHVSVDNLQPGDLIFYGYSGRVSHVGIYIGNSQIIHSNDERTGIIISGLYPKNGKPYIGAKRVI